MPKQKPKSIAQSKSKDTGKKKKLSATSLAIIIGCSVIGLLVLGFAGYFFYQYSFDFNGTILENVTIAGVDVGGMTRSQAVAAVNAATADNYSSKTMVVKIYDITVEIPASTAKVELDVDSAVWDAYKYGRRGFSSQQQKDRNRAANGGIAVDLSDHLEVNKKGIRNALSEFGNHYTTELSQTTYEVTGTAPDLTLVVNLGTPEYCLDMDALYNDVINAYENNQFQLETECILTKPEPLDLEKIIRDYETKPVDAYYNEEKFEVVDSINGCTLNAAAVQATLDASPYGQTVKIPFDQIEPKVTGESLSSVLFRDVLATHTGTQDSSSGRATNLRLACESINGVILYPGDTFSYNQTLGERTTEKGYQTGIAYVGGESVPSIGGGICQVSSTLYYCALQADLEILARDNHSYAPGYVPLGMDATVNWGTLDFSFRNNKDYPIKIEAHADGGSTTVTLWGTDYLDYYIKMEYVVTGYYDYKITYEEMTADNEKGYKDGDYIKSPIAGFDVVTYRCKYNKADDSLISKDLEAKSAFRTKDAVICKIVTTPSGGTEETTPPETTPSETTPPETTPSETTPPETTPPEETTPGIGNGGVTEDSGALPE